MPTIFNSLAVHLLRITTTPAGESTLPTWIVVSLATLAGIQPPQGLQAWEHQRRPGLAGCHGVPGRDRSPRPGFCGRRLAKGPRRHTGGPGAAAAPGRDATPGASEAGEPGAIDYHQPPAAGAGLPDCLQPGISVRSRTSGPERRSTDQTLRPADGSGAGAAHGATGRRGPRIRPPSRPNPRLAGS